MSIFHEGQIFLDEFPQDACDWVNEQGNMYGMEVEPNDEGRKQFKIFKVQEPTIDEQQAVIQKKLTDAVQHVLDAKAQELLYDNCLSVCSYIDTGVARFDAEGRAFRAWRSQVWSKGYEILAQVQSGERDIPTEAELIAELPELVIVYDDASA